MGIKMIKYYSRTGLIYVLILMMWCCLSGCGKQEQADPSGEQGTQAVSGQEYKVDFQDIQGLSKNQITSAALCYNGLYYTCFDKERMSSSLFFIDFSHLNGGNKSTDIAQESTLLFDTEDRIQSIFTGAKEEFYLLSNVVTGEDKGDYLLYCCDREGQVKDKVNVTQMITSSDLGSSLDLPIISNAAVGGNVLCFVCDSSGESALWMIDVEANTVKEIRSDYDILDLAATQDNNVYAAVVENAKVKIVKAEDGKSGFQVVMELPEVQGMCRFVKSESGELFLSGRDSLYSLDFSSEIYEERLSWTSVGISGYDIQCGYVTQESDIQVVVKEKGSSDFSSIAMISERDASQVVEKEIIVLGSRYIDNDLKTKVAQFNVANNRYQVEIAEYPMEDRNRMAMEILAGEGPDLLDLENVSAQDFTRKGLMEDLTPYLEKSSRLSREDLVENVLKLNTVNGILTCIPPAFVIETISARASQTGDKIGWTIEEFFDLVRRFPEAEIYGGAYYGQSKGIIVYMELLARPEKYIDWNTYTANFDTPLFIELLEFASDYETKPPNRETVDVQILEGDVLLYNLGIWNVIDYMSQKAYFQDDVTFIGYPSEEGSPSYGLRNMGAFGIRSGSKVKEGAWEFLEFLITAQKGTGSLGSEFPTLKSALQDMFDEGSNQEGYYGENNEFVPMPKRSVVSSSGKELKIYAAATEDVEQIQYLIDHAMFLRQPVSSIDVIIEEELDALFAGQKTAEQTAEVIQNRVQLYLDESKDKQ